MTKSVTALKAKVTAPSVEDLTLQMDILKDDLKTLTQTLHDLGAAKATEAKETVTDTTADLQDAGREKMAQAQAQAEDFVRTQPATAVGIAAGLGFLVGMLTAQRR